MTTTLKAGMWATVAVFMALALLVGAGQASAQSEVTGTLTSGSAATGSTATGTITGGGTGNTISGTVVEEDNGGGGGGGGSRRGGSSNNNDDDGEVLGTDTSSGVGGSGDVLPGVPSTGAGQDAAHTLALLLGSFGVFAGGLVALRRYAF